MQAPNFFALFGTDFSTVKLPAKIWNETVPFIGMGRTYVTGWGFSGRMGGRISNRKQKSETGRGRNAVNCFAFSQLQRSDRTQLLLICIQSDYTQALRSRNRTCHVVSVEFLHTCAEECRNNSSHTINTMTD